MVGGCRGCGARATVGDWCATCARIRFGSVGPSYIETVAWEAAERAQREREVLRSVRRC